MYIYIYMCLSHIIDHTRYTPCMCVMCVWCVWCDASIWHACVWCDASIWRGPTGCHKLQVIFHKRATNYSVLLRKMTRWHESFTTCMYVNIYVYMYIHMNIRIYVYMYVNIPNGEILDKFESFQENPTGTEHDKLS